MKGINQIWLTIRQIEAFISFYYLKSSMSHIWNVCAVETTEDHLSIKVGADPKLINQN